MERLTVNSRSPEISAEELRAEIRRMEDEMDIQREELFTRFSPEPAADCFNLEPLKEAVNRFERDYVSQALKHFQGNKKKTAEALKVNRSYLYELMNKLGIT